MVRKGDPDITNARPAIEGLERRLLMSGAWNVALIDSTLADSDLLVRAADGADRVAVYDGSAESAVDVLSGLADQANSAGAQIASLTILSHGSAGQFNLGDESISSSSLGLTADAWTELGEVMEDGGSISIYGCNVADGSAAGQALLDSLAALTGTYVFASDDLTGAGGDWELEAASSGAEAELAAGALLPLDLVALSDYSWSLADPVANDDEYEVDEDGVLEVNVGGGVLANDTDGDGDHLHSVLLAEPDHGVLVLNDHGSFTYTPDEDFDGVDIFTYRAYDGSGYSLPATVTITVNGINDAPVIGCPEPQTTTMNTPLTFCTADENLISVSDVDAGEGELKVTLNTVLDGTLTLNSLDGLSFSTGDGVDDDTMVFTGTLDDINAALDGMFFQPGIGYVGEARIQISVNDQGNTGVGGPENDNVQADITVVIENEDPVAEDDAYEVNEDNVLAVDAETGVLDNDTDPDGDPLTAVLVDGPEHGELTLNDDGSFTYTPDADYSGADSFTYVANDGTTDSNIATVSLTVNAQNDDPVAEDDAYEVNEDNVLTVNAQTGVLDNDTDADGDPLTAVLVDGPDHGELTLNDDGSFTYTPDADYVGADSFTYKADDGTADGNVATVSITVNAKKSGQTDDDSGPPADARLNSITSGAQAGGDWVPAELLNPEPAQAATAAASAQGRTDSDVETEPKTEDVLAKAKVARVVTRRARVDTAGREADPGGGQPGGDAAPAGHPQQAETAAARPEGLATVDIAVPVPQWVNRAAHVQRTVIGSAMASQGPGLHELIRQGSEQLRAQVDELVLSGVWKGMETVKRQMEEAAGRLGSSRVILLGAAAGVVATASAGYLVWSAWSGSLMSSVLAMIPVWRGFDPLPVLDRWEKSRRKGKKRGSSQSDADADETDRQVDRLVG